MKKHIVLLLASLLYSNSVVWAAFPDTSAIQEEYNPNSLNPIPYSNILIKKRIWRHIDLREKLNRPLSPYKKELARFITEGVRKGELIPYKDEEFKQPMSKEAFIENLAIPEEEDSYGGDALDFAEGWGDEPAKKKAKKKEKEYFAPSEVTILEVMEDLIFDKVRSVQVYDIQSIKLIIPADKFDTGLYREVAIFRYKDLAPYLDQKNAAWLNVKNNAGNIKITSAFALRSFSSKIYKIENPNDHTVADIYNHSAKAAALASQELEEMLLEEEFSLWEH